MTELVCLDIGCGANPIAGYTGVDLYVKADIQAPMWQLPFGDNSVDKIYSSHALEHVTKAAVVPTLKEWYRVLKVGGTLMLGVPDLEYCCRLWLAHKTNDWYMDIIFGNQDHVGEIHMTGFTKEIMLGYLEAAGFSTSKFNSVFRESSSHRQRTLVFELVKE
jgi:predicted SAM-dependent methyltransferase